MNFMSCYSSRSQSFSSIPLSYQELKRIEISPMNLRKKKIFGFTEEKWSEIDPNLSQNKICPCRMSVWPMTLEI